MWGHSKGTSSSNIIIKYCYNTGSIVYNYCSGICGRYFEYVTIFNCYNTGNGATQTGQAGIIGYFADNARVYNCWSSGGGFNDNNSGGIAGLTATSKSVDIYNCYYIGDNDAVSTNVTADNVQTSTSSEGWNYTKAKATIGTESSDLSGSDEYELRWHIPGYTDQWVICDSVDGNNFDVCNGNVLYCDDETACNIGSQADCVFPGSREDCDGYPLYCTDPVACNYNDMGECTYHGSRQDCDGNNLYCDQPGACNYGELGTCVSAEENYNCNGSWVGDYCPPDTEGACNPGSRANCWFPGQKDDRSATADERVDCDGNPLYCTDPAACNYDGENGECIYHGSREDCDGNPLVCTDPVACNYNEMGKCEYHGSREDCDGNPLYCTDSEACNYNELGKCIYQGSREDCDGNPKYCTDPVACNYNEIGDCEYHGSREDCGGDKLYCDDITALNYNQLGTCDFDGTIEKIFGNSITYDSNNNTYTVTSNFEINDNNSRYFPIPIENGVTFDGGYDNGFTITYSGSSDWSGLFSWNNTASNGFTIKNVNFNMNTTATFTNSVSSLLNNNYDGSSQITTNPITVVNCHLDSTQSTKPTISNNHCGGIVGQYFCGSISNCSNSLEITGYLAGGICGNNTGNNGSATITYSYNTGSISGTGAGGICGAHAGTSGNVTIDYCYNIGYISGTDAAGICGRNAGKQGELTIFNCYNNANGTSGVDNQGGITGSSSGIVNIYNCWSKGSYLNDGIVAIAGGGTVLVTNCYSIGSPINEGTKTNSYNTDSWDDTYAYYTIGQNNITGYTDVRWNNDNVTEWLISVESGMNLMGSFAGSYALGTANQGDQTWGNLNSSFLGAFDITDDGRTYTLNRSIEIDGSISTDTFPISMPGDGTSTYTFDGGFNKDDNSPITITITAEYGSNWPGLFRPVAGAKLNIKNVKIIINKTLADYCGALVGDDSGGVTTGGSVIENCHVTTDTSITIPQEGGGLFGTRFGYGATVSISDCSNSLFIYGEYAGGICGLLVELKEH